MKRFLNRLFENHALIFRLIIYMMAVIAIVYLFPRGGQFKYQFQKGHVWQYDDFYAPFDFAIQKTNAEIEKEKSEIKAQKVYFFRSYDSVIDYSNIRFEANVAKEFSSLDRQNPLFEKGKSKSEAFIQKVYEKGFISTDENVHLNQPVSVLKGNKVSKIIFSDFFNPKNIEGYLHTFFADFPDETLTLKWEKAVLKSIQPNVVYDKEFSDQFLENQLNQVLVNKGFVQKGTKIIAKGDIIEQDTYEKLSSVNAEYDSLTWSHKNYYWLIISYTFLVALVLMMLLLFLHRYRPDVEDNISKVTFIFTNMFLMVLTTMLILKFNAKYLYLVPYTLMPLLIKAFLDPRLGLFTHVLTVLLLGFLVPNSFEFIFIQIIAGIVTILTVSELNKRANIFLTVGKIVGVYLLTYAAFTVTHEGNAAHIDPFTIFLFILNGLLTASLIIPFIFLFEKTFGLVSDETLREFSDTNHKLLKELNEKAPGTFQHSMQVANLAEEACKEIGANALLARTGAMYHDIGKIYNPLYFIENQSTGANPHAELDPEESAQIIIDHVVLGIELAKKHKLPDRLIDFIRTHHGTNLVYYFYKKEEEFNPDATNINKFRYPGPIPFSKETAIVMICDATEAASKSLKDPTAKTLDLFVDKIVKSQMENGQYQNADITFKEVEKVKKVVKKKLKNIYHIRIEYPE